MEGVVEHADRSTRAEGSGRAAVFAPAAMLAFSLAASLCATSAARAQDDDVTKIGVLNDMSGLYSDIGGVGNVAARIQENRHVTNPSSRDRASPRKDA